MAAVSFPKDQREEFAKKTSVQFLDENQNHEATAKLLLGAGADVNKGDFNGETAIIFACQYGYDICLDLLIKAGADVNVRSHLGVTALWKAAQNGQDKCLESLLKAGASVNDVGVDRPPIRGITPLMAAASHGHDTCLVKLLQAGADVNSKDSEAASALMKASTPKCMEVLLNAGADISTSDITGITPLMVAAINNYPNSAKLLIERGADVNVEDTLGTTALDAAAVCMNTKIMKILLDGGADVNRPHVDLNMIPLVRSAYLRAFKSVDLLIKAGADVNILDNDGASPLINAVSTPDHIEFDSVPDDDGTENDNREKCVELLLDAGADVNISDKKGITALMKAAENGMNQCLERLLRAGANVNKSDRTEIRLQ